MTWNRLPSARASLTWLVALAASACAPASVTEAAGDEMNLTESDALFDQSPRDFALELSPDAITALNGSNVVNEGDRPRADGVFSFGGKRFDVEVRIKGQFGSFRTFDSKPGLKIKFKPQGQTKIKFMGASTLTLNNLAQDRSMLAEALAFEMYRAQGIPTPRTSFVGLHVNGQNFGVYLNVETVNDSFLKTNFGNADGGVFEGPLAGHDIIPGTLDGLPLDSGDESMKLELAKLADAIAQQSADELFFGSAPAFDTTKLVSYLAVDVISGNPDGYVGAQNNFRLYFDPAKKQWSIIPSTPDRAFERDLSPFDVRGVLAKKCIQSKRCLDLYRAQLVTVAAFASGAALKAKGSTWERLIADPARLDTRKITDDAGRASARDALLVMLAGAAGSLKSKLSCTNASINGSSYAFCGAGADFITANSLCATLGKRMLSMETDVERLAVHAKARQLFGQRYWSGVTDEPSEGNFRWLSRNAPISFTLPWLPGEPNGGGNENCAEVSLSTSNWNDTACSDGRPFVCKQ